MGKLGVNCRKVLGDTEIQVLEDDIEDHELLSAGRAWIHNSDPDAAKFFQELADEMIQSGEGEGVIETCQELVGESGDLICAISWVSCPSGLNNKPGPQAVQLPGH